MKHAGLDQVAAAAAFRPRQAQERVCGEEHGRQLAPYRDKRADGRVEEGFRGLRSDKGVKRGG